MDDGSKTNKKLIGGRIFRLSRRALIISTVVILAIFILSNVVVFFIFRERTYPHTVIMQAKVGSVAYSQLPHKITSMHLLPGSMQLKYQDKKLIVPVGQLGLTTDYYITKKKAESVRPWLPFLYLFKKPHLPAPVKVNETVYRNKTRQLYETFHQDTASSRIILNGSQFSIEPAKNGYKLDEISLKNRIFTSLNKGSAAVAVPVKTIRAKQPNVDLNKELQSLQSQQKVVLKFRYQGKDHTPSVKNISAWYVASGETYALSRDAISAYIAGLGDSLGIKLQNLNQAVTSAENALSSKQDLNFTLLPYAANKSFTFCTALRGVDGSALAELQNQLSSTYGNQSGWSLGGQISFSRVSSGCNFTVWLTAADQMPAFGAICEPGWSCSVGNNVVINFDRWRYASAAWNTQGGSLTDYRQMVINHETGHWLGFGHKHCTGPGQPAPVMQQQSIDLEGCLFNPWPTPSEKDILKHQLKL